jgi:hypothetical protein
VGPFLFALTEAGPTHGKPEMRVGGGVNELGVSLRSLFEPCRHFQPSGCKRKNKHQKRSGPKSGFIFARRNQPGPVLEKITLNANHAPAQRVMLICLCARGE